MKRLLPLLLVLCLLLAGCGRNPQVPTQQQKDPTKEQTGLYDPKHPLEKATYGAVKAFPLEKGSDYCGLLEMGNRLLLVGKEGALAVLQGDTCANVAAITAENPQLHAKAQYLDATAQGVAYYAPKTQQIVLLNPQLQEVSRVALPAQMQGEPVIHLDAYEAFYCVSGQIMALNLQNGLSRLVRSHSYETQQLLGSCFDGTVLIGCFGEDKVIYFSAETGRTLYDGDGSLEYLYSQAGRYFASRMDGCTRQRIVGTLEGTPQAFMGQEELYAPALAMGGVVSYTPGSNTALRYYDLDSGLCTAQVTLYDTADPMAFLAARETLWILTNSEKGQLLCCWDMSLSPAKEETQYVSELITAENPDLVGIAACQLQAGALTEKYGVQVHLWQDALQVTGGYDLTAEYQVSALSRMLRELEAALEIFPEGFLTRTLESGDIHVNLVRSTGQDDRAVCFWHEGDCYIFIGCEADAEEAFLYGFGFAMDAHVLGNSRKFDDWALMNPEGFVYTPELGEDTQQWLTDEDRAFLEAQALRYPHYDRSTVFLYAMTQLGQGAFDSPIMQQKLLCMCRAIREAYRLEKSTEVYPWEQYLQESLAYVKK